MTMRTDMAAMCEACKKEPAFGRVAITAEHYAEATKFDTLAEKRDYLENQASLGCCDGAGCFRSASQIETRIEDGKEVEYMVTRCGSDPNSLRGDLIDS